MSTYKVGDELAFSCGWNRAWEIYQIESITPTGRMKCGRWMLNADMTIRGRCSNYGPYRGEPVTDKIRKEIKEAKNLRFIQDVKWREVPNDVLDKLVRIIKEHGGNE